MDATKTNIEAGAGDAAFLRGNLLQSLRELRRLRDMVLLPEDEPRLWPGEPSVSQAEMFELVEARLEFNLGFERKAGSFLFTQAGETVPPGDIRPVGPSPVEVCDAAPLSETNRKALIDFEAGKKKSPYFGVNPVRSGKWAARLWRGRDAKHHLGIFDTELEAAIAVQEKIGEAAEVGRLRQLLDRHLLKLDSAAHKQPEPPASDAATAPQYKGVRVRAVGTGKRWHGQVNRKGLGGYKHLGSFPSAIEARIAVEDYLGNKVEADQLRSVLQQEKKAVRLGQDKPGLHDTTVECDGCGKAFEKKPEKCDGCGDFIFRRPRRQPSERDRDGE